MYRILALSPFITVPPIILMLITGVVAILACRKR